VCSETEKESRGGGFPEDLRRVSVIHIESSYQRLLMTKINAQALIEECREHMHVDGEESGQRYIKVSFWFCCCSLGGISGAVEKGDSEEEDGRWR